jgi:hypothetical protein
MLSLRQIKRASKKVSRLYKREWTDTHKQYAYFTVDTVEYSLDEDYVMIGIRWGMEKPEAEQHHDTSIIVPEAIKDATQLAYFIYGFMTGKEIE